MIKREQRRTEIGPGRVRYRILVTGEPCPPPPTHESRHHQFLFINWLADNQTLIQCGYSIPLRVVISHNGTCWQAECEAECDEPTT